VVLHEGRIDGRFGKEHTASSTSQRPSKGRRKQYFYTEKYFPTISHNVWCQEIRNYRGMSVCAFVLLPEVAHEGYLDFGSLYPADAMQPRCELRDATQEFNACLTTSGMQTIGVMLAVFA